MLEERHVKLPGGVRLHYAEDGAGSPPILLIHGLGSAGVKFYDAIPSLAQHRRTIALDLPGFGRSDAPRGSYAPGWAAGAVRAFMDELGIERAIVAGNSYGGLVATYLAATWPERVEALMLAAPVLPNDGPPSSGALLFVAGALPLIGPRAQARYWRRDPKVVVAESLLRNCADPARVSFRVRELLEQDVARKAASPSHRRAASLAQRAVVWAVTGRREITWRVFGSIRVPTVLLWGDADRVLPVGVGHVAITRLPGAHLIVMDDCGHNPQMEKPEEFAGALLAFSRSLEGRAPGTPAPSH